MGRMHAHRHRRGIRRLALWLALVSLSLSTGAPAQEAVEGAARHAPVSNDGSVVVVERDAASELSSGK